MKLCKTCREEKPRSEYVRNKEMKDGLLSSCKTCVYAKRDKHKSWAGDLRRCYGITPKDYEAMMTEQGGVCAFCGNPPGVKRLAVDHCHRTGSVRGLLCHPCNAWLGRIQDNPDKVANVIAYLAWHGAYELKDIDYIPTSRAGSKCMA